MGIASTGLLGTWTLTSDPTQVIEVRVGAPPSPVVAVPGPLPLMGAAAAFGFSRRLRHRVGLGQAFNTKP